MLIFYCYCLVMSYALCLSYDLPAVSISACTSLPPVLLSPPSLTLDAAAVLWAQASTAYVHTV